MTLRLALTTVTALCTGGVATAETINWTATLDATQEVGAKKMEPGAAGEATGTLDTETGALDWNIAYDGLSGPAQAMHFHGPAAKGENAGVVQPIDTISGAKSPSIGMATLTADQVKQVEDGMWYINIHTAENPDGEIRGQVMPSM